MARYTVTLYTFTKLGERGKLTPLQVNADDNEGAQEAAITQCENAGIIHGDIVSIVKHTPWNHHGR